MNPFPPFCRMLALLLCCWISSSAAAQYKSCGSPQGASSVGFVLNTAVAFSLSQPLLLYVCALHTLSKGPLYNSNAVCGERVSLHKIPLLLSAQPSACSLSRHCAAAFDIQAVGLQPPDVVPPGGTLQLVIDVLNKQPSVTAGACMRAEHRPGQGSHTLTPTHN